MVALLAFKIHFGDTVSPHENAEYDTLTRSQ